MSSEWSLRVTGLVENQLTLRLDDILKLPVVTLTFDFRCIEGWVIPDSEWQESELGMFYLEPNR